MRSDVQVSRLFTDTHEQLPRSPGIGRLFLLMELTTLISWTCWVAGDDSQLRNDADPWYFGGGPMTATQNPSLTSLTLSVGDGETYWGILLMRYTEVRNADRKTQLLTTSTGVYVPSSHEVTYHPTGFTRKLNLWRLRYPARLKANLPGQYPSPQR